MIDPDAFKEPVRNTRNLERLDQWRAKQEPPTYPHKCESCTNEIAPTFKEEFSTWCYVCNDVRVFRIVEKNKFLDRVARVLRRFNERMLSL